MNLLFCIRQCTLSWEDNYLKYIQMFSWYFQMLDTSEFISETIQDGKLKFRAYGMQLSPLQWSLFQNELFQSFVDLFHIPLSSDAFKSLPSFLLPVGLIWRVYLPLFLIYFLSKLTSCWIRLCFYMIHHFFMFRAIHMSNKSLIFYMYVKHRIPCAISNLCVCYPIFKIFVVRQTF